VSINEEKLERVQMREFVMFHVRWIICISRITRGGMKQGIINAEHLRNIAGQKI
jgi:hypothetical protein